MIPEQRLSSSAVWSPFQEPKRARWDLLVDYEVGGVDLQDPTRGYLVHVWTCRVVNARSVQVSKGGAWVELFSWPADITEVALSFDTNMRPFVAFVSAGVARFWWYDQTVNESVFTVLPAGSRSPRCCMDEKRAHFSAVTDNLLAYLRGDKLFVRQLRDRYQTEYLYQEGINADAVLVDIGMSRNLRMQWELANIKTELPGALVRTEPLLMDVVTDLVERAGVSRERVDAAQLIEPVTGYKVAVEGGANVMIEPLQAAHFFDPGEWDGKLHFVKRGGEPVAEIGSADLVERDGPAIDFERVQEAELLRKVNVISIDPEAGYTVTSQSAERRSGIIQAKGEATVEVPLTLQRDDAAQVADKRLKIAWSELQKIRNALTVKWSHLTGTDIVLLTDKKGAVHRIRLMDLQEDSGVIDIESSDDAPWAYDSNATGLVYRPPASTTPGLIGPTTLEVLNIPVMRDQDDEPGVYIAACGVKSGWDGAEIQVSTDGGATNTPAAQVEVPATIGYTVSALAAEVSSEYLSHQVLRVYLPDPPASVDYETLLRYFNRAAVKRPDGTWEVLQYQTATPVDATTFDLSGLVRGRYATAPEAVPAGAAFVLIDDALVFAQAQQWMIGQPMQFRGVSYGVSADGVAWQSPNLSTIASQTEWPVHSVTASRDGADTVAVRWVGRARLGAETAPHHSKYFRGWRVEFSDGFATDTIEQQYTRAGTPPGVTVTVAPINHLTGQGPASESIPT
jgi:hypothetical protein